MAVGLLELLPPSMTIHVANGGKTWTIAASFWQQT